jgi:hypothetical protein
MNFQLEKVTPKSISKSEKDGNIPPSCPRDAGRLELGLYPQSHTGEGWIPIFGRYNNKILYFLDGERCSFR